MELLTTLPSESWLLCLCTLRVPAPAKRLALHRGPLPPLPTPCPCSCCNNTSGVRFLLAQRKMGSCHIQTGAGGAVCLDRPNIERRSLAWKERTALELRAQRLMPLPSTANSEDFSPTGPFFFPLPSIAPQRKSTAILPPKRLRCKVSSHGVCRQNVNTREFFLRSRQCFDWAGEAS